MPASCQGTHLSASKDLRWVKHVPAAHKVAWLGDGAPDDSSMRDPASSSSARICPGFAGPARQGVKPGLQGLLDSDLQSDWPAHGLMLILPQDQLHLHCSCCCCHCPTDPPSALFIRLSSRPEGRDRERPGRLFGTPSAAHPRSSCGAAARSCWAASLPMWRSASSCAHSWYPPSAPALALQALSAFTCDF